MSTPRQDLSDIGSKRHVSSHHGITGGSGPFYLHWDLLAWFVFEMLVPPRLAHRHSTTCGPRVNGSRYRCTYHSIPRLKEQLVDHWTGVDQDDNLIRSMDRERSVLSSSQRSKPTSNQNQIPKLYISNISINTADRGIFQGRQVSSSQTPGKSHR
ncbi:hypothetical protein VTN02DRAFT_5750 [Thermoascus thermophilus]